MIKSAIRQGLKSVALIGIVLVSLVILREKGYLPFLDSDGTYQQIFTKSYQTEEQKKKASAYSQFMYGLIYEQNERYDQAVRKFKMAKAYDPDSIMNRIHLGVNLVHADRKDEAALVFEEASRMNPSDPKVKTLTALLFASQSQYPEAISQFQSILIDEPEKEITEADAKEIFQNRYAPRNIKYVVITPDRIPKSDPDVPEERVEEIYEAMKNIFTRPEAVDIQYVRIQNDSPYSSEEILQTLEDHGIQKASDYGLKIKQTGFMTRSDPISGIGYSDEIIKEVFKLKNEGQLTPWIQTDDGKVICSLVARRASGPIPYEEAKSDIKTRLIQEKKDQLLLEFTQNVRTHMNDNGFEDTSVEENLKIYQAKEYRRGDYLDKAGILETFDDKIAPLGSGQISEPVIIPTGFVLVKVEEVDEYFEEGWEKEKENILNELQTNAQTRAYGRRMRELWSRLRVNAQTMQAIFPNKYSTSES